MEQSIQNLNPPNWQACVTTIKCDLIDDFVSIMVKKDWSSKCTWYDSYKAPTLNSKKKIKPDRSTKKRIGLCQGPLCSYVINYREKLINETKGTSN
jgi:hypothetical protein